MNKKFIIYFLGAVILLGALLWWMESSANGGKGSNAVVYDDWSTEYDFRSKNPQDLAVLKSLIQAHTKDSFYVVEDDASLKKIKNLDKATFLFVGKHFQLSDRQYEALEKRVDKGANLFVSSELISVNIYSKFFENDGVYWDYNKAFYQWVGDTSLRYNRVFEQDTLMHNWFMFNPKSIKDSTYRAYLFSVNMPTAFYQKKGEGKIHFHANPTLFKNYQTLSPNGFVHVRQILKYIPKEPVVVLAYARVDPEEEMISDLNEGDKEKEDTSYLRFIMESEYLRTAFLLAIVTILLYALFRSKRRENVLPEITQKRNMSIAFVETLSSIYLSKRSNIGVLQVMRKNFFFSVHRHFYVDLIRKESREEQVKRLIERTGYPAEKIHEIVNGLDPRKNNVTEAHLGHVNKLITEFYRETGAVKAHKKYLVTGQTIEIHKSLAIGGLALIVAMMVLLRGLQLLSQGGGMGIVLAVVGVFLIFIASRIISKPVAVVKENQLIIHGFLFGKKTLDLSEHMHITVQKGRTEFATENGKPIYINHTLLSKRGMSALKQLIEHLKKENHITD